MTRDEIVWLDEHSTLTLDELAELASLEERELLQLVDIGALVPVRKESRTLIFSSQCVVIARTARRLRQDLDLDAQGVGVALALIERVRELEDQVRTLRAQAPGSKPGT